MKNKRRIYGIDIVRIFSCISVYTQHYLGMELDNSKDAVGAFRESPWFKSIFGIFWGELVLISFFVISGFFITYNSDRGRDLRDRLRSCVYRCLSIIIPTAFVILFTAFVTMIMRLFDMSDMFSLKEVGRDMFKVLVGIPGDKHIHYAYPLWFQHFMLMGYIYGYVFVALFAKYDRLRPVAYVAVLVYSLFNSEYTYMVFMGMAAGEICSDRNAPRMPVFLRNNGICSVLLLAIMSVMAAVYSMDYDRPIIYGPAALFISLILILIFCIDKNLCAGPDETRREYPSRWHKIIDFLSENTYACYLIHFFVFCSLMRIIYRLSFQIPIIWKDNNTGCIVMYVMMTLLVWTGALFFTKFVLSPLKRIYDVIWKGIQGMLAQTD